MERIGVLISAAGMSRRMGQPKQLMKIGSQTFLQHILDRFSYAKPDITVVVTGYMAEEVRESLRGYDVRFLYNPDYVSTQMLDSVRHGLKYLQERCDRLFFMPVDVPLFDPDTLLAELACSQDIILPVSQGRIGHPILIRTSCIEKILRYQGSRGLKGAIDEFPKSSICYLPVDDACGSMDADTPEDVQKMIGAHEKKTVRAAVFGAGQTGRILSGLLKKDIHVCCYIDNDTELQDTEIGGIPVLAPEQIEKMNIERIYLAAVSPRRQRAMKRQLLQLGCRAEMIPLSEMTAHADLRLAALRNCADMIRERNVPGECAELGVYKGAFASEICRNFPDRKLYLFDTFEGFDAEDLKKEETVPGKHPDFADTSEETVLSELPYPENAVIIRGHFPDSLKGQDLPEKFCFVSLDPDLYEPAYEGLCFFWNRLSTGGIILINDYDSRQFPGIRKAADRFCAEHDLYLIPLSDMHGSVILLKQGGCHG